MESPVDWRAEPFSYGRCPWVMRRYVGQSSFQRSPTAEAERDYIRTQLGPAVRDTTRHILEEHSIPYSDEPDAEVVGVQGLTPSDPNAIYVSINWDLESAGFWFLREAGVNLSRFWGNLDAKAAELRADPALREGLREYFDTLNAGVAALQRIDKEWHTMLQQAAKKGLYAAISGRAPDSLKFRHVGFSFQAEVIAGTYTCPQCGDSWPVRDSERDPRHPFPCQNCGDVVFQDDHMLNPAWGTGVRRLPNTDESYETYDQLVDRAQEDGASQFTRQPRKPFLKNTGDQLWVSTVDGHIVAYAYWNEDDEQPVLRHLHTLSGYRRQGHAERLLRAVADHVEGFGIESPEPETMALLVKLGYAKVVGDEWTSGSKRLFFVRGL